MTGFAAKLGKFTGNAKARMDKVRRATVLNLFGAIIRDTPVLTGQLRGNWQTSINDPVTTTTDDRDPTGGHAMVGVVSAARSSGPNDTVVMRNNLPYAERIEYEGWSSKAPEGMVRRNVARFRRIVDEAARENKL